MTTATTEPRTDVITAAHKRALRHADSICFDLLRDGQAQIRAIMRADNPRNTTGFEQIVYIMCGNARVNDYGPNRNATADTVYGAYYNSLTSVKYSATLRTLVDRVKIGGSLRLNWTRDNNSDTIRMADLHFDMLHLVVFGPEKDGHAGEGDVYLVTATCTPDNSARMIQRY